MSGVQRTIPRVKAMIPTATSAWAGRSQPFLVAVEFILVIFVSLIKTRNTKHDLNYCSVE